MKPGRLLHVVALALVSLGLAGCLEPPTFEGDPEPDTAMPDTVTVVDVADMVAEVDTAAIDTAEPPDTNLCEVSGPEVCDDIDNDCNGEVDEGCDDDGDDYCDATMTVAGTPAVCPNGPDDCDDTAEAVHPNANEDCDDIDNNCVAGVDELCDADGDDYCDSNLVTVGNPAVCPNGGGDCDETRDTVNPGITEVCDDRDNDCEGGVDEGCDDDGDGWCDINETIVGTPAVCAMGVDDCDDMSGSVYPGAPEQCDQIDNDCNGPADDNVQTRYWDDTDGDGAGDPGVFVDDCMAPMGYVGNDTDCDPMRGDVHPNAVEQCGAVEDLNCDGKVPELQVPGLTTVRGPNGNTRAFDLASSPVNDTVFMAWVQEDELVPAVHVGQVTNGQIVSDELISPVGHAAYDVAISEVPDTGEWLVAWAHRSEAGTPAGLSWTTLDAGGVPQGTIETVTSDVDPGEPISAIGAAAGGFIMYADNVPTVMVQRVAPGVATATAPFAISDAPTDLSTVSAAAIDDELFMVWLDVGPDYRVVGVNATGDGLSVDTTNQFPFLVNGEAPAIHPGLIGKAAFTWFIPNGMTGRHGMAIGSLDNTGTLADWSSLDVESNPGPVAVVVDDTAGVMSGHVIWQREAANSLSHAAVTDATVYAPTATTHSSAVLNLETGGHAVLEASGIGGSATVLTRDGASGIRILTFDDNQNNASSDDEVLVPVNPDTFLRTPLFARYDAQTEKLVYVQQSDSMVYQQVRIAGDHTVDPPFAMVALPPYAGCALLADETVNIAIARHPQFSCLGVVETVTGDCMSTFDEYEITQFTYDDTFSRWNADVITTETNVAPTAGGCAADPVAAFGHHALDNGGDMTIYTTQTADAFALHQVTRDAGGSATASVLHTTSAPGEVALGGGLTRGENTISAFGSNAILFGSDATAFTYVFDANDGSSVATSPDVANNLATVSIAAHYWDGEKYALALTEEDMGTYATGLRFIAEDGSTTPASNIDISAIGQTPRGAGGRPEFQVFAAPNDDELSIVGLRDDGAVAQTVSLPLASREGNSRRGLPILTDDDQFRWLVWDEDGRVIHVAGTCVTPP